jgi:hypothetical protein
MTSDKSVSTEARLNALVNQLGNGVNPQVDGQTYELGVWTKRTSGTQDVRNSTQILISGLQGNIGAPGGAQDYAFEAWIDFHADAAVTATGYLSMAGTATVSTMRMFLLAFGNGQAVTYKIQDTFGVNSSPAPVNFTLSPSVDYLAVLRGHLTCTAAGTLQVNGATSSAVDAPGFTTRIRSLLRCWPTVS